MKYGDILPSDSDPPAKPPPWGVVAAVVIFIGLVVLVIWITREKKNEQARDAVLSVLDKELESEQEAIKLEREKVMDLTRRVETMRSMIQLGQVQNGKAAVAEFHQLAKDQRAERDKFTKMAEEYNKKVAKYRELQPYRLYLLQVFSMKDSRPEPAL